MAKKLSDIEIAKNARMQNIEQIAKKIDIKEEDLELYGKYKAKLSFDLIKKLEDKKDGKLVLVTATNPTKFGEGKSTMTIGLSMALNKLDRKSIAALREPSMGPVFGIKGGAAGGGYSQVLPMDEINLHFTGDMHAITAANNLLCAAIDNHINQGNSLNIDSRNIFFKRVLDMNDRALRDIVIGMGGVKNGFVRQDSFMITVASEVMAILCLSKDINDLKYRLSQMIIACDTEGNFVKAEKLKVHGAMAALLKDAIKPNLVQTIENTPAIIHGGPFANIAHGCNSIIATKLAMKLSDITVTEAGFGADLGAEKFLDIKCQTAGIKPDAVVIVSTVRSLKLHSGEQDIEKENIKAIEKGFCNLKRHVENIKKFNLPVIVTINRFYTDTEKEIEYLKDLCRKNNFNVTVNTCYENGSEGAVDTAKMLIEILDTQQKPDFKPVYDKKLPIKEKIEKIAKEIYRADGVIYEKEAEEKIQKIEKNNIKDLYICIAKTQYSFSDDPSKKGSPEGFKLRIRDVSISNGAGFLVALAGDILTMPGLPKVPSAENIDIDENGSITGLF